MRDHKEYETEYTPLQDSDTYQTGSVKAPSGSSAMIALLLSVIVLLMGLFTAMGLINVRMFRQLLDQPDPTMPLSKEPLPVPTGSQQSVHLSDAPLPSIPDNRTVELALEQAPHYFGQPSEDMQETAQDVYAQNADSLVQVYCLTHNNSTQTGIGVVLTADGYLLTNAHVVDSASRITVLLSDGTPLRAALVGSDPFTDLAVLYVQARNLVPARFCFTQNLQVTEPTFALEKLASGSAEPSMVISGVFGTDQMVSRNNSSLSLLQTFQGAEQGPVFNSNGQIIGMHSGRIAGYFDPEDTQGLGLVIPSDEICKVVSQLTDQGHIPGRPHLGMDVEKISTVYQNYWGLPGGMMLTHIHPGSTAQQQGLRPGDILLALDGQAITSREELYQLLYSKEPGERIIAVIYRDQTKFTVELTVGELLEKE